MTRPPVVRLQLLMFLRLLYPAQITKLFLCLFCFVSCFQLFVCLLDQCHHLPFPHGSPSLAPLSPQGEPAPRPCPPHFSVIAFPAFPSVKLVENLFFFFFFLQFGSAFRSRSFFSAFHRLFSLCLHFAVVVVVVVVVVDVVIVFLLST